MVKRRARRLYHRRESDSYFVEYPDRLSKSDAAMVEDVTGSCPHEIEAEKQGVTPPGWRAEDGTEEDDD